jgi:type II secretory pathway pseudopilin PulG
MTLIEVVLVMTVMLVAISMLSGTLLAAARQRNFQREEAIASLALRNAVERLRELPCQQVYASYNADPADDPLGPGTAPGPRFATPGLTPLPEAADGLTGTIVFPEIEVPGGAALREDVENELLGMPRDLNGDNVVDALDHSSDYLALPLEVRVEWSGQTGRRQMRTHALLVRVDW